MANWLDKYDTGGKTSKYVSPNKIVDPFGLATAKTDVTKVVPSKKTLTAQERKRVEETRKRKAAEEAAKNRPQISADTISPEQRAQARKAREIQEYINNSQLAQTFTSMSGGNQALGAIGAKTAAASMLAAGAAGAGSAFASNVLPYIGPALNTNLAGVAGLTGNNILNAGFAAEAINNIPNVKRSIANAYNDPTLLNVANATSEAGLTAIGALPFASAAASGVKSTLLEGANALDKAIYPTRTYRASLPGGNRAIYEGSGDLANKVFSKGDWTTSDLRDATQYLSGIEVEGGRPGLLTGENMNLTEYKVPFWKKSVAADKDVIALKKLQGDVPDPNEYIIPNNKFLYPRRTNLIQAVPNNVKEAVSYNIYNEPFTSYQPGKGILSYNDTQYSSPAYKYVEDQINAVTGHQMPYTFDLSDFRRGIQNPSKMYNWQQPQFAPNAGIGKFERFGNTSSKVTVPNTAVAATVPINREAFQDAHGFLRRRQFVKDLQKQGLIGKEFGEADARYAARSTDKTNALTKLALDADATYYRGVQGSVPENGIGYQDFTGREFNMSKPAWNNEISEFENMTNAGVDFNDPMSIAEYQASHIPMEEYGYRSGMPRSLRNVDALYTSERPNTYGNYQMRMTLPRDYSEGNYSDWVNKYFKPENNLNEVAVENGYYNRDYIPDAPYETPVTLSAKDRNTVIGTRGQKMFDVDKSYPYSDYKNLSGSKLDEYKSFLDKLKKDYNTGFRGQYKNGGWLDKFDNGGEVEDDQAAHAKREKEVNTKLTSYQQSERGKGDKKVMDNITNFGPRSQEDYYKIVGNVGKGLGIAADFTANALLNTVFPQHVMDKPEWARQELFKAYRPVSYPGVISAVKDFYHNPNPAKDAQGMLDIGEEAWSKALRLGEKSNYIIPSTQRPGNATDPNAKYYTYKKGIIDPQKIIDFVRSPEYQKRRHKSKDNKTYVMEHPTMNDFISNDYIKYRKDNKLTDYFEIDPIQGFQIYNGWDPVKKKNFAAIYDKYDFDVKTLNSMIRPYEFYDKFYYKEGGEINANNSDVSFPPNFVGQGYDITGRDYSPAWGGQFAMGGSMPGAVGFTYARTQSPAPSNGKYAKKTKASAQNGKEMKYYQNGLDFKPRSVGKNGSVIKDDMGQWAHPGEITEIGSNQITMQGVPYPVLGISDTGDTQMMYPNQEYQFIGDSVTEYPMMQKGGNVAYVDSVFNANKDLNWVKRLYDVNRKSIMLPGKKDPATHFMESGDGRVYPTVVEMPDGKLKHLGDKAYDYADSTKTFIQFPNDSTAQWFGKNYKKGTGVLKKKKQGGQLTKLDQLTNFTNYNTKQPGGWLDKYQ